MDMLLATVLLVMSIRQAIAARRMFVPLHHSRHTLIQPLLPLHLLITCMETALIPLIPTPAMAPIFRHMPQPPMETTIFLHPSLRDQAGPKNTRLAATLDSSLLGLRGWRHMLHINTIPAHMNTPIHILIHIHIRTAPHNITRLLALPMVTKITAFHQVLTSQAAWLSIISIPVLFPGSWTGGRTMRMCRRWRSTPSTLESVKDALTHARPSSMLHANTTTTSDVLTNSCGLQAALRSNFATT